MAKQSGKTRGIDLHEATSNIRKVRKAHFLGIGIDRYSHFPKLANAVRDVKDIARILEEQYQFDPNNVHLLLDEAATREGIITQLDKLVHELGEENDLMIYYSGHGHLNEKTGKGFWIPINARPKMTADYIPNAVIKGYIEDIPSFHTFLISDSCFSGSLFVEGKMRSTNEAIEELDNRPSRWALCSGRHDEEVYDGSPGENSPFAASIIAQLQQAKKSELNVGRLIDEVIMQTRAHYRQLPEGNPLFDSGHQGGQFVFRLKYDDARDWQSAKEANTVKAYENYLALYPEGEFAREAASQLVALKDEAAWAAAQEEGTSIAYDKYLEEFPEGRHAKEALGRIKSADEEQEWQRARQVNELWGYRSFLQKFPGGKYAGQAEEHIKKLREKPQGQGMAFGAAAPASRVAPAETASVSGNLRRLLPAAVAGLLVLVSVLYFIFFRKEAKADNPDGPFRIEDYQVFNDSKYGSYYAIQHKENNKWGFYNPNTGFSIAGSFDEVEPFNKEMALVKKEGKYGWIDKLGNWVIEPLYDTAQSFDEAGVARVALNGRNFYIDRSGKEAQSSEEQVKDRTDFEAALDSNRIEIYNKYLNTHRYGQFREEAAAQIKLLEEEAIWMLANNRKRYQLYQDYIAKYPKGAHIAEAKAALRDFIKDPRDSKYYRTIVVGDMVWMAENMNYDSMGYLGACYNANKAACDTLGRLYTWAEARRACPDGWGLPSAGQWSGLQSRFRLLESSVSESGSQQLDMEGVEEMKASFAENLGGRKVSGFKNLGEMGFYWTPIKKSDNQQGVAYQFNGENEELASITAPISEAYSCRCVKRREEESSRQSR